MVMDVFTVVDYLKAVKILISRFPVIKLVRIIYKKLVQLTELSKARDGR